MHDPLLNPVVGHIKAIAKERDSKKYSWISLLLERRIVIFRKREYLKRYFEAVGECFFGVSETGDEPFLLSEPCQYFRVNTRTDASTSAHFNNNKATTFYAQHPIISVGPFYSSARDRAPW